MPDESGHRCGFVALAGRPNVGKSTLVNALVQSKVSIVTPRPQTTRHRIAGIRNLPNAQVVFVDTPGIHRRRDREINRMMNRVATNAIADADVVLFVCEALRLNDEDEAALERLRDVRGQVFLVVNKVDAVQPKTALLPFIQTCTARRDFAAVFPVSALKKDNLAPLLDEIVRHLPESPPLYPRDRQSDRDEPFHAAEVVREKLTWRLRQELPYGLTVAIERFETVGERIEIDAVIWVEREGQKAIVIGKGGAMLKAVGQAARRELKTRFGQPVHLTLWVKVKENWSDSARALKGLGFDAS